MSDSHDLERDLLTVRQRLGLRHPDLAQRVGQALRAVGRIEQADDYATVARKIREIIESLEDRMDGKYYLVLRGELNMLSECRHDTLTDRQAWLANELSQSPATIRPWGEKACKLAASLLLDPVRESGSNAADAAGADLNSPGYYYDNVEALLHLDRETPEAMDRRKITATRDGVSEILFPFAVPRVPGFEMKQGLDFSLEYGGSLRLAEQVSDSYFRYCIDFPQPLKSGESHEYAATLKIPVGQPMLPHYTFTCFNRCDLFELRIRFDPVNLPKKVMKIEHAYMRDNNARPVQEFLNYAIEVSVDRFGESFVAFRNLRVGLSYGMYWEFSS